jgi:murein DD-endopeptidase MepM/ murein hydrolase activator NlpD
MTSPYGMREHPVHGGQRLHAGIDYATPEGTQLNVAGRFVESKWDKGGGGNMSIYDIGGGKEAVLLHGA